MVVADNIRAELSRQRWSGRKAAIALGLTPTYVSRRLSGETPLDANDIYMFAEFLSAPVSKLFELTAKGQPSDYKATVSDIATERERRAAQQNRHLNGQGNHIPEERAS